MKKKGYKNVKLQGNAVPYSKPACICLNWLQGDKTMISLISNK